MDPPVLYLVLFLLYTTGSHGVSTDEQKYREVLSELDNLKEMVKEDAKRMETISNAQASLCRELGFVMPEEQEGGGSNTGGSNTGGSNTGGSNKGGSNTGGYNTGGSNTGGSNTGGSNTGGSNTGGSNKGGSNTGGSNTGGSNTGGCNTGGSNTGGSNTGGSNAGGSNTGGSNTGGCNTGGSNTGGSNAGGSNTGGSNAGGSNIGGSNAGGSNTRGSNTGGPNTGWANTGGSKTGESNTGGSNTGGSNAGGSNTGGSNTGHSSKNEQATTERPPEARWINFPVQLSSIQVVDNSFQLAYRAPEEVDVNIGTFTDKDYAADFSQTFSEGVGVISGETGWRSIYLQHANFLAVYNGRKESLNLTFHQITLDSRVRETVVFEPTKTATVKIRILASNYHRQFSYTFYTPSREEPNTVMEIISHSKGFKGIINDTEGEEEVTIVLNHDREDYEGILSLAASDMLPGFRYQYAVQTLSVVRSDHTKPFEDGYLGFYKMMIPNIEDDKICSLFSQCFITDMVLGDRPADMTLWKFEDGQRRRLDLPRRRFQESGNMLRMTFVFANVSLADEGRYLFQATSVSGTIVEKEFNIKLSLEYSLLEEQSKVLKETPDVIIVQCVGKGYPNTEIRFYTGDIDGKSFLKPGNGISIMDRNDDFLTTSILMVKTKYVSVDEISCTVGEAGSTSWTTSLQIYDKE